MNKSWRRSPQQQKKKVEEDAQAGKHEVHLGEGQGYCMLCCQPHKMTRLLMFF